MSVKVRIVKSFEYSKFKLGCNSTCSNCKFVNDTYTQCSEPGIFNNTEPKKCNFFNQYS